MNIIKYSDYDKNPNIITELMGIIPIGHKMEYTEENKSSAIYEIGYIKQQKQAQYSLNQQLSELILAANKLGLYDAADFINNNMLNK